MKTQLKKNLFLIIFLVLSYTVYSQNNSVGINTLTPNPNSVLELISPNNNQGLLVPKLTTAQRNSSVFLSKLSLIDNGLLVYDTDFNSFFWWTGTNWTSYSGGSTYIAGTGIDLSGGIITNTLPSNPKDELINTLNLNTTFLEITEAGILHSLDLSSLTNSADNQTLTLDAFNNLSISNGNSVSLSGYLDNTDSQTLALSSNNLSLTNGGSISLAGYLDNTDSQTLALTSNNLTLTNGGSVSLSGYLDNTDAQTLTLDALNNLSILNGNSISLSGFVNTDNQDLTISGNQISLSNDLTPINISTNIPNSGQVLKWNSSQWQAADDNNTVYSTVVGSGIIISGTNVISATDNSIINEIQDLNFIADILKITNNASATSINLASYREIPAIAGNGGKFLGTDGTIFGWATLPDNSNTNEIQDLSLLGNVLSLSSDITPVDLTPFMNTYTAGTGITIDGTNKINSLWSTYGGSGVILANSMSNVGIGISPDVNYRLNVGGKLKTAGIQELSDERYKINIQTIENPLEIIHQLCGVNYKWNIENFPDKNFETGLQMGLIAQQVEKVIPYMVETDENGFKSVEYSHLVALLVEAIKEQQILIEEQQNQINNLKISNTDVLDKYKYLESKLETQQTQIDLLLKYMESSNIVQQTINH